MLQEAEVVILYLQTETGELGNPLYENEEASLQKRNNKQRNMKKTLLPWDHDSPLEEDLTNPRAG